MGISHLRPRAWPEERAVRDRGRRGSRLWAGPLHKALGHPGWKVLSKAP